MVAQTAILGSILVNALFVLGLVIVAGSLRAEDRVMRFSPRLPNDAATLLMIASFIILLVGFLLWIAYGAAAGIPALVIPNIVALLVGATVIIVALHLRRPARKTPQPPDQRVQG